MNHRPATLLVTGLLTTALCGCTSAEKPKESATAAAAQTPQAPLTVEESIEVSLTAKVKAIDHASRVVTLQDKAGHEVTIVADRSVTRLHEVVAGDDVNARYKASLLAELRPPTAEESANPVAVVTVGGRAQADADPARGVAQAVRVVTTVEAVDVPNMLVTLRGPMGDVVVVRGRKPENVKRLRVGDTIVITFTETLAISLEKVGPR